MKKKFHTCTLNDTYTYSRTRHHMEGGGKRPRSVRDCTDISSVPQEILLQFFQCFVTDNYSPLEDENYLKRVLVLRLVTKGLSKFYFGPMARLKFIDHMEKREKQRKQDPCTNNLVRSMINRCCEAADVACEVMFQAMFHQSDLAAFAALRAMILLHERQTIAIDGIRKANPISEDDAVVP